MVTIKVFTLPSCPNCPTAKEVAMRVAKKFKGRVEVRELNLQEHFIDALQLGVASTPAIVIENNIIARGEVPEEEILEKEVKKCLKLEE